MEFVLRRDFLEVRDGLGKPIGLDERVGIDVVDVANLLAAGKFINEDLGGLLHFLQVLEVVEAHAGKIVSAFQIGVLGKF